MLSKTLRIVSVRETKAGKPVKWPEVMEVMIRKAQTKIFLKSSHLDVESQIVLNS